MSSSNSNCPMVMGWTAILKVVFSDEGVESGEEKTDEEGEEAPLSEGGVEGMVGLTPAAIWYHVRILEVMLE